VPPQAVLDEMTEWMFGHNIGMGQGLAPFGQRGRYACAMPTVMNVTAQCFSGCPLGAVDRVRQALWTYIRGSFCVGAAICKDQMRATIYAALGPDPCMSNVQLEFDESLRNEDAAKAYLACGHFLVLGDVDLKGGYQ
jgi:Pyruvate/2-oxoacid:ferredoxin oxidoreductase delta subunit